MRWCDRGDGRWLLRRYGLAFQSSELENVAEISQKSGLQSTFRKQDSLVVEKHSFVVKGIISQCTVSIKTRVIIVIVRFFWKGRPCPSSGSYKVQVLIDHELVVKWRGTTFHTPWKTITTIFSAGTFLFCKERKFTITLFAGRTSHNVEHAAG